MVCCPCVLQPKGHSLLGIRSKRDDERCLDLVFFLEANLMVARVAIKERQQDVASCRVDDLVDAWEREAILRVVSFEISIIYTHSSFIIVIFKNEYSIS
jgi:hypothetical protein